jgi:serine/threonine protein phosphatase PrpC
MGCDGIWEKYVEDTDGLVTKMKDLLKTKGGNYKEAVETLLDELLAKETKEGVGCDNMTAILIGFV